MTRVDLTGRVMLITGASSGIGRATALACARAGMGVFLTARREDALTEAVRVIHAGGGRAGSMALDVQDADACADAVRRAEESLGPLYGVFANAGYGQEAAIHEMTDEAMRRMFEVNFFGSLHAVRPALPGMIERGEGHVLFCSSCVSLFALPYYGCYSATKAAQHHIGRAMRLELAPRGVRVSTVHPVGTRTAFFDVAKAQSEDGELLEHTPDRFMQPPERVARAVVRCLRRPRPEVWTSQLVRWGMAMAAPLPRVADAAVRGMVTKRLRRFEEIERELERGEGGSQPPKGPAGS